MMPVCKFYVIKAMQMTHPKGNYFQKYKMEVPKKELTLDLIKLINSLYNK